MVESCYGACCIVRSIQAAALPLLAQPGWMAVSMRHLHVHTCGLHLVMYGVFRQGFLGLGMFASGRRDTLLDLLTVGRGAVLLQCEPSCLRRGALCMNCAVLQADYLALVLFS
jgi:hypothetical protein